MQTNMHKFVRVFALSVLHNKTEKAAPHRSSLLINIYILLVSEESTFIGLAVLHTFTRVAVAHDRLGARHRFHLVALMANVVWYDTIDERHLVSAFSKSTKFRH